MYAAASVKRQKVARETPRPPMENTDIFQGVGRIEYKPDNILTYEDQLSYRYYNSTERIHGRQMDEWLRASVYCQNFLACYSLGGTLQKVTDSTQSMETSKKNIRALFEMCLKLGTKFWSGYQEDLVPEADTFDEIQANCEHVTDILSEYQLRTGIKPLWIGVKFKHLRYSNGAATNSNANILAIACYQVKNAMDMAHKLNAECFLINTGREGYDSIMNTDISKEMKHYARFLKMIVEYRDKIGFRGQLLLDPLNGENVNFKNYTNNIYNLMLFMKYFNFDRYYKVNVQPGHDFNMSNTYGLAGCIDVRITEDIAKITLFFRSIIEKGGFGQLGITFYMPVYNHVFVEPKDVMVTYINAIDMYAKALRLAVKLVNDIQINKFLQTRYISFQSGWGAKFMTSDCTLADSEENAKRQEAISDKSNHWYVVLQRYVDSTSV